MQSIPSAIGSVPRAVRKSAHQPLEAAALPNALLTLRTVTAITGLSASTIYRKLAGGHFPSPVRLGSRCTRFPAQKVREWLAQQTPPQSSTAQSGAQRLAA